MAAGVGSSEPSKLGRHELRSPFHGRGHPQALFYSLRDAEVCNFDPPGLWRLGFNKDVLDAHVLVGRAVP